MYINIQRVWGFRFRVLGLRVSVQGGKLVGDLEGKSFS